MKLFILSLMSYYCFLVHSCKVYKCQLIIYDDFPLKNHITVQYRASYVHHLKTSAIKSFLHYNKHKLHFLTGGHYIWAFHCVFPFAVTTTLELHSLVWENLWVLVPSCGVEAAAAPTQTNAWSIKGHDAIVLKFCLFE